MKTVIIAKLLKQEGKVQASHQSYVIYKSILKESFVVRAAALVNVSDLCGMNGCMWVIILQ